MSMLIGMFCSVSLPSFACDGQCFGKIRRDVQVGSREKTMCNPNSWNMHLVVIVERKGAVTNFFFDLTFRYRLQGTTVRNMSQPNTKDVHITFNKPINRASVSTISPKGSCRSDVPRAPTFETSSRE